jgi:glutaminyl-peptide cyclotransferase
MRRIVMILLGCTLLTLVTAAQDTPTPSPEPELTPEATAEVVVELLVPTVLNRFPHDPDSFTQGLVLHEGVFYESAGLYGESDLREVAVETGDVIRQMPVDETYFAEGLALVEDRLIQITWQESTAFIYDRETFEPLGTYTYEGEGWGLCYDGSVLWMSDGTEQLEQRDPDTFEVVDTVDVTLDGRPLTEWGIQLLNELECVGDSIYANVWQTTFILRIEAATGIVTGVINAADLLTPEEWSQLSGGAVLNGIAYNAEAETFYLTGKHWPWLFEVMFEPVGVLE